MNCFYIKLKWSCKTFMQSSRLSGNNNTDIVTGKDALSSHIFQNDFLIQFFTFVQVAFWKFYYLRAHSKKSKSKQKNCLRANTAATVDSNDQITIKTVAC